MVSGMDVEGGDRVRGDSQRASGARRCNGLVAMVGSVSVVCGRVGSANVAAAKPGGRGSDGGGTPKA